MKSQSNRQSAGAAAMANIPGANSELRISRAVLSSPTALLRALLVIALAATLSATALAQNIYVSTFLNGTSTIGEYKPDGSALNASFVTAPETYIPSLSSLKTTLMVPAQAEFPYNDAVVEVNGVSGQTLNVYLQLLFPRSAYLNGPHIFVLYGATTVAQLGEYNASDGSTVNASLASIADGQQMAGWTDSSGNVHLYITRSGGAAQTGSIEHILISGSTVTTNTLVGSINFPNGIAVSADGQYVYAIVRDTVSNTAGEIAKYSTSNGTLQYLSQQISGTPFGIAVYGAAALVTGRSGNRVGEYYAANGASINDSLITGLQSPTGITVGPPTCIALPSNAVAWYPFDQSGSSQTDRVDGNTATAYNTASIPGEVSGALQFNGSSSYVEASEQSQLDLGTGDFSIDAWVKVANSADDSGVVVVLDKRNSSNRGYHLYLYNGRIGVQLADGSFQNYTSDAGFAVPPDNRWHLIAVTVTRSLPNGGTFYLDGFPIGNFDPTAHRGSLSTGVPLDIGVRSLSAGGGGYFKGGIDEVEIFNRALGSGEVFSLMQAGIAGKCKL